MRSERPSSRSSLRWKARKHNHNHFLASFFVGVTRKKELAKRSAKLRRLHNARARQTEIEA
jgi:hypothetical protein